MIPADEREEGGVRVSNRAIYDQLLAVRFEVADMKKDLQNYQQRQTEHSKRLRSLEIKFYGIVAGMTAALMVLLRIGGVV